MGASDIQRVVLFPPAEMGHEIIPFRVLELQERDRELFAHSSLKTLVAIISAQGIAHNAIAQKELESGLVA